jgi:RNA polymerase sigma-70 factor (sigma-E family)
MRLDENGRRQFADYFAARHLLVRRTAYLLCGDWYWADDLTQSAFIKLARGWRRIRDQHAIDAYMRTCVIRTYLAEARRVWRQRERPYGDLPDVPTDRDSAESSERRIVFAAALMRLAPRQRATLVCRYYHGLDVAETAAALGCSEGTVKSQTAKGLSALRLTLADAELILTVKGTRDA